MKIALFARPEIIEKVNTMKDDYKEMEIISFPYTKAKETAALINQAFLCDIYIFGETLSYLYVKRIIEKKKLPKVIIAFDEYKIMSALYSLSFIKQQPLHRLSVDVYQEAALHEVFSELKIHDKKIYPYAYEKYEEPDLDKILHFHQQLWADGKIDYVLTSIKEVEEKLAALHIPASCMIIPNLNIKQALEKALAMSKLNQNHSIQIVQGYVQIKNWEAIKKEQGETAAKGMLQRLHEMLLSFGKQTGTSIMLNHDQQIVLFGTKGLLTYITNHYGEFPLLTELEASIHSPVDIGFGLGLTPIQAQINAKAALESSTGRDGSNCYVVNERREKIGPIGIKKEFDTSKLYYALIHKARLNNELSYNFIDFINLRNNEPFSSQDVAVYYRVTKRSAERTINKLLSGEVIKIVGEEKPYVRGRPRKLFALNQ
jgi:hypothetical protein